VGRPILIFRDRACPFTPEDVELLRDNLSSAQEWLAEKLNRSVTTIDPAMIDPSDYQGLLDAIHVIRQSGVNISDDLRKLEAELKADVERGVSDT